MRKLDFNLQKFKAYLSKRNYSDNSIKSYIDAVFRYMNFCNLHDFDYLKKQEINLFLDYEKHTNLRANSTLNLESCAIVCFYGFLAYSGAIAQDQVPTKQQVIKYKYKYQIKKVYSKDVEKFYNYIRNLHFADKRKIAFLVIYATGIRVGELCNTYPSSYKVINNKFCVELIATKNGQNRTVPFMDLVCAKEVYFFLSNSSKYVPIFPKERAVQYWFSEISDYLGIKITPHLLRHNFAYRMLNVEKLTISQLMELLGHRNPAMSMRYALPSENDILDLAPDFEM